MRWNDVPCQKGTSPLYRSLTVGNWGFEDAGNTKTGYGLLKTGHLIPESRDMTGRWRQGIYCGNAIGVITEVLLIYIVFSPGVGISGPPYMSTYTCTSPCGWMRMLHGKSCQILFKTLVIIQLIISLETRLVPLPLQGSHVRLSLLVRFCFHR
jgi:hypothetical protein